MIMKKITLLSLLFAITCNGQVFSMEDSFNSGEMCEENYNLGNQEDIAKLFISSVSVDKYDKKLPYTYSDAEIKALDSNTRKSKKLREYYYFVKKSFNILQQHNEELEQLFLSNKPDGIILDNAIKIVKEANDPITNKLLNNIELLENTKSDYANYINDCMRDIIHNNIYSVVITLLFSEKIDLNKIENEQRRKIVNCILLDYKKKKNTIHSAINTSNCEKYLVILSGTHKDIFDKYKKYFAFSGLSFGTFLEIINSIKNNNNITKILDEFYSLVSNGYITNPYIVDYIYRYDACNEMSKFVAETLANDNSYHIYNKIVNDFNGKNYKKVLSNNNIIESYKEVLIEKLAYTNGYYSSIMKSKIEYDNKLFIDIIRYYLSQFLKNTDLSSLHNIALQKYVKSKISVQNYIDEINKDFAKAKNRIIEKYSKLLQNDFKNDKHFNFNKNVFNTTKYKDIVEDEINDIIFRMVAPYDKPEKYIDNA